MLRRKLSKPQSLVLWIFAFVAMVVLFQVLRGFFSTLRLLILSEKKKKELVYTYAKAASLKNQLDRITSEAYKEEFLKSNLGYFEPNEMLVILEGTSKQYVKLIQEKQKAETPYKLWFLLFTKGKSALKTVKN